MQLLATLSRALKIPDLKRRIYFTFWMFVVFRAGAFVPVPGIDPAKIQELFKEQGSLVGFLDLFAGGALSNFSIFAMGIMPYINASIIMQLLTMVVPKFEEWSKEGEEGRKKLTQLTRYGTVVLSLIQAVGLSFFMQNQFQAVRDPGFGSIALITLTLTAGTAFLMWLGEQITEFGIGNGISLLIFAGIVSRLPSGAGKLIVYLQSGTMNVFTLAFLVVMGLLVIAAIVWIQEGQRRIPVQYSKRVVGRRMYGGTSTHIPMRINQAGVIPVIFASAVLSFPPTIAQFIPHPIAQQVADMLDFRAPLYISIYFILIIFFTYFYTAVTFNPADVANNIKKYGGFIPGLRPGKPTAEFLERILVRITLAGAIFLALIAVLPYMLQGAVNINIYFGGTALLIVVGVALETMKQIEAHLLMRHYQGFIK